MGINLKSFTQKHGKKRISAYDITLMALMVAIIEVCKFALAHIPNVELTSFWIIMFSLYYGWRIFYVLPVFILIEGIVYGFGLWWIMYLYVWPILAIATLLFRKQKDAWDLAIISCVFGLTFGFFSGIPNVFLLGMKGAFAWWIAGIPWDIVHGVANFAIMLVLYKPINFVMSKLKNTNDNI